jgi:hypothetical protein
VLARRAAATLCLDLLQRPAGGIPTTPLMRRKIMRIRATGLMLKLASTGTKKLQMPRKKRATLNVSPCAVVLSMVGNSS